ncbi:cytochrome P450 2H1-like [Amblyomma americanum]
MSVRPPVTQLQEELSHLVQKLTSLKRKPAYPDNVLTPSTTNVIAALLFGQRLAYDDPKCARLNELIAAPGDQGCAPDFILWLRKLLVFFSLGTHGRLRDALVRRDDFSDTVIDIHVETYKEGVVQDYIGAFLGEKEIPSRESAHL